MAKSYKIVGDRSVAGKEPGELVPEKILIEWPANIPALIEGGHLEDPTPAPPAPPAPEGK